MITVNNLIFYPLTAKGNWVHLAKKNLPPGAKIIKIF